MISSPKGHQVLFARGASAPQGTLIYTAQEQLILTTLTLLSPRSAE